MCATGSPCSQSPGGVVLASAQSVAPSHSSMWPGNVYGDSAGLLHPAGPITSSPAHSSSPDPCHNGGSCSDGIGTFFCECLAGFRGPKCEEDINECASNPCKNGANCTDCVNSYTCTCPSGFSGIHCENNTPDCTERYSAASWARLSSLCCPIALGWCVEPLAWAQPAVTHWGVLSVSPAPASTVGRVWMASTPSPVCACLASRAATVSTTSMSVTPSPA